MAQPYIGEIRLFGGNYAPQDWVLCNGRELSIAHYEPLYSLIGTTYGGDGNNYFRVPDLRGRVPVGIGRNATLGQEGGVESVTLTVEEIPPHTHPMQASSDVGSLPDPIDSLPAQSHTANVYLYLQDPPTAKMSSRAISFNGGSGPHENRQPYLALNYIIAIAGIYPPEP